ncbi:MAG: hypothetical protein PGN29_12910 [Gordonia paraffinivorans]
MIGVSGIVPTAPPSSSGSTVCAASADVVTTPASSAGVRRSNTSRGVNTSPASRARVTRPMAMMLSPPRGEERVVDADLVDPERLGEQTAQRLLDRVRRGP